MTLDIKREVFDQVYQSYAKLFYSLGDEEGGAVSNLSKEDGILQEILGSG